MAYVYHVDHWNGYSGTGATPDAACAAAVAAVGQGLTPQLQPAQTSHPYGVCRFMSGSEVWDSATITRTGEPGGEDPDPEPGTGTGTTVTCSVSPCVITVHHKVRITHPLLDLTPVEGAQIAGSILAVWAIGVIFRMIIKALNTDGTTNLKEE